MKTLVNILEEIHIQVKPNELTCLELILKASGFFFPLYFLIANLNNNKKDSFQVHTSSSALDN